MFILNGLVLRHLVPTEPVAQRTSAAIIADSLSRTKSDNSLLTELRRRLVLGF